MRRAAQNRKGGSNNEDGPAYISQDHSAAVVAGALPMSLVRVAFGSKNPAQDFTFGYISDAHIQQIEGVNSCETGIWASSEQFRKQTC